mgnify:CR=1 FL=1
MRNFINIVEADIEFERGIDKVVAKLKSYDSQSYTKLAQKVERIEVLEDEIKALKAQVKSEAKEHVHSLFEAEDTVRTRVVDTVSFIITLSKDPKPTETVQYAKVIAELEKSLTPELVALLENLKAQFKTVTQKEPSLKIAKKDLTESFGNAFARYTDKFNNFVSKWSSKYDKKLDKLKQLAFGY